MTPESREALEVVVDRLRDVLRGASPQRPRLRYVPQSQEVTCMEKCSASQKAGRPDGFCPLDAGLPTELRP